MEGAKLVAHRGTQLVRYEDPAQYQTPGGCAKGTHILQADDLDTDCAKS